MSVIIANNTPPDIRGQLKRWFLGPRPNVFVGTLNARPHCKVMEFIMRNAPAELGLLVISSHSNCQGYIVNRIGPEGIGLRTVLSSHPHKNHFSALKIVLDVVEMRVFPPRVGMALRKNKEKLIQLEKKIFSFFNND